MRWSMQMKSFLATGTKWPGYQAVGVLNELIYTNSLITRPIQWIVRAYYASTARDLKRTMSFSIQWGHVELKQWNKWLTALFSNLRDAENCFNKHVSSMNFTMLLEKSKSCGYLGMSFYSYHSVIAQDSLTNCDQKLKMRLMKVVFTRKLKSK